MDTGENNRPNMLRLYRDWRMAKIFFLGFISGFPWLLIASMVALWLKEEGLSRSGIGLFGLVFGVYAINALWAPVIDGIKIPFLSKMFGQRRAWIILMQIVIAVCMLCIFLLPSVNGYLGIFENFPPLLNLLTQYGDSWWAKSILILDSRLFYLALLVFIIATASATQDVAIDATRIEMIKTEEPEKISAGSAMATSGWWLGFGGGKALALPLCPVTTRSRNRQRLAKRLLGADCHRYFVYYGRYFFHSRPRRSLTPAADTRIHGAASGQAVCQSPHVFCPPLYLVVGDTAVIFYLLFQNRRGVFGTYVAGVLQRSRVHQNGNWFTLRRFGHYHGMRFFHFRQFRQRPLWATERAFLGRYRHGRNQPFLGRTGHLAEQRIICRRRCRRPIYHRRIHRCFCGLPLAIV